MTEEKKRVAAAMPVCAAWVEELRQALGVERVNAAMAAGQQARRAYARIEAEQGKPAADAWLRRQRWPHGRLYLAEAGQEVGVKCD